MPIVKVMDMTGKEVGEITLSEVIFGAEINGAVLHAAVRTYLMNQRQGTQSTLTRTEEHESSPDERGRYPSDARASYRRR